MLTKPKVMAPYTDPVFGATVVRISNSAYGEVHKPAYSTMQAWNADESLLLLYRTGGNSVGHELRDGHTYEFLHDLDIQPADLEEIFWSHKNPDEMFYVSAAKQDFGQFRRLNPLTRRSELIADFSHWCGRSLPVAGSDVHMQSRDDDLFGFRCRNPDGEHIMFSYRISSNETVVQPIGKGTAWSAETAPTATASGHLFLLQGTTLAPSLESPIRTLDVNSHHEHSSIGTTAQGADAMYQVAFGSSPNGCDSDALSGIGHLVEHNLETGVCRNIISQQQGFPYPTSSTHISAIAHRHESRVALSSVGTLEQTTFFKNGQSAPALYSEVYVADTGVEKPQVCRLAHHRSFGKNAVNGGYAAYFGEPHATISPTGTRVLFGSDWYDSGSVDSYVVELGAYIKP